ETGCPLIKDSSGGAEMYGGDLREHGTFDDFHPYCDAHFYPSVLEGLRSGPREKRPVLLGEYNDFDVHRDLSALKELAPYWASQDQRENDNGVRWQHDLPTALNESRWARQDNVALVASSAKKGAWVRRSATGHVRSIEDISGYVVTGWRHTPISTSGLVDDALTPVFSQRDIDSWNAPDMLFPILARRPPWIRGGNRPGWLDPHCFFVGQVFVRVGLHSEQGRSGALSWKLGDSEGEGARVEIEPCVPQEVAQISVHLDEPGRYELSVSFDGVTARWPIWVVEMPDWRSFDNWSVQDQFGLIDDVGLPGGDNLLTTRLDTEAIERARNGSRVVALLQGEGTLPMPFWRECAFEFAPGLLDPYQDRYERLWAVASDCALDPAWIKHKLGDTETLMNRVDTRTYAEHPYVARAKLGKGSVLALALRPYGALGAQPWGVARSPSGTELLRRALSEQGRW
ncbi:MAG: hypothetical protein IH945_13010, partial [Armatimonadetes bacterium]|nr:hypothetical protein [Armatimonadota bacterium]